MAEIPDRVSLVEFFRGSRVAALTGMSAGGVLAAFLLLLFSGWRPAIIAYLLTLGAIAYTIRAALKKPARSRFLPPAEAAPLRSGVNAPGIHSGGIAKIS